MARLEACEIRWTGSRQIVQVRLWKILVLIVEFVLSIWLSWRPLGRPFAAGRKDRDHGQSQHMYR